MEFNDDFSPKQFSLICDHCPSKSHSIGGLRTNEDFILHLRNVHCTKEGGSFVCKYGANNICQRLPFEGVSDGDYRDHVIKFHLPEPQLTKPKKPKFVNDTLTSRNFIRAQNLAAVLNDPRKSRREVACFFTRYWSDNFVEKNNFSLPANLIHLNAKDFADYLMKTSKRKKWKHVMPKFSDLSPQQNKNAVKDMVPEMFFSSKYNVEDSRCFEALFLTANVEMVPDIDQYSSPDIRRQKRLKPTELLEEKLSFYLDSIEIQIARHVSSQSGSFFRAMTSHEDLQKSLAESLSNVENMRRNLRILDGKFTSKCLRLLNLKRTRSNRDALLKKVMSAKVSANSITKNLNFVPCPK
uniref:Uncharacterized protein n=1 Tax=Romanomermis culicivorax TaxID=13658 RepID=A0A915KV91_ROMCU